MNYHPAPVLCRFASTILLLAVGCGGGTSGSTPIGSEKTLRVEVRSDTGTKVPGEAVSVPESSASGQTNDLGVINVEVNDQDSVTVQLDSAPQAVALDLSKAPADASLVAAVVQVTDNGTELLAQAELTVELQGACEPYFERRNGIDFVKREALPAVTPCTVQITQTREGKPDSAVRSWGVGLECRISDDAVGGRMLDYTAPVDGNGTAVLSLELDPANSQCDYIITPQIAPDPGEYYRLGDNFLPRISLR